MEVSPETGEQFSKNSGKNIYEIEGHKVGVRWKKFEPQIGTELTEEARKKAIVVLPGWALTEDSKTIDSLSQSYADEASTQAYSIDTRSDGVDDYSLVRHADAIAKFITEEGITQITGVGNSQGGAELIHLSRILQEKYPDIKIDGLILLDSVGLYDQSPVKSLTKEYVADLGFRSGRELAKEKNMSAVGRFTRMSTDGLFEILREVGRSKLSYPKRLLSEIKTMSKTNPDMAKVTSSVILVQGEYDRVSSPDKIIPDGNNGFIESYPERGEYLEQNLFPSSPYVRMVVARRLGTHNVSHMRPEQVAKTSLYLLSRSNRVGSPPAASTTSS